MHDLLADLAKATLTRHQKQWRIKERMILTQILLALISSHLCLLTLRLQQLYVQIMWPGAPRISTRCGCNVSVLHEVLIGLLQLDGSRAHATAYGAGAKSMNW